MLPLLMGSSQVVHTKHSGCHVLPHAFSSMPEIAKPQPPHWLKEEEARKRRGRGEEEARKRRGRGGGEEEDEEMECRMIEQQCQRDGIAERIH